VIVAGVKIKNIRLVPEHYLIHNPVHTDVFFFIHSQRASIQILCTK